MKKRLFCLFFVLILVTSMAAVASAAPTTLVVRAGAVNDGHAAAWSGPAYTTLRNRAGQAADTATYANYAGLHAKTTQNQYDEFYRAVILFNTAALPDDCTVTAVKFGVRGVAKKNGLGSFSYGITGFNPTRTDGTFVMGDYQRFYNDRWADSDISYANLLTSGWNNWTGNSKFVSNISKTGWTGVMVRDKPDIDNNSALITWKSGATSKFDFQDTGSGTAPFLEITYTTSTGSPVAAFTSNVTSGTAPLSVKFTDQSTGAAPLSYAWDFDNNGITDSTLQNPVYTYSTAGSYTANLTVTNTAGSNSITHIITVNAAPVMPTAVFSTNVTSGTAPLAVKFTDASTGTAPLTYAWDFDNNGITDSTLQNPVFTYSTSGSYTANLTVTNTAGSNSITHIITVNAAPVMPTAVFSTNVTSGTAPLAVKFTDQSTGTAPLTYAWDFDNNGITDSTLQNPVFTYSTSGSYTANLTVTNTAGSNSITHVITVNAAPVMPTAVFSTNVTSGTAPLAVKFTDQSTGTAPLTYAWDFDNNGITDSTLQNPVYTYSTAGSYTANLTVSNTAGSNSITHIITVNGAPVMPTAVFSTNVTSGTAPLAVKFTDASTGTAPLTYAWDFDNNGITDSTLQNPVFTYSTSGSYTANLTVTNTAGSNSITHVITVNAAPVMPTAVFSTNVTSGTAPLAVKFTDQSTGTAPLTYAWDFDNNGITDSTLQNPVYTYSTAGSYTANLTVTNTAGSNSITHVITVNAAPVIPTAVFSTNVTSGTAPLAVKFTDQSTGTAPLTYAWDFDNNGITDSTLQNPVFTYSTSGSYTANLTVSNTAGSNSITHVITVNAAPVIPTAVFSTNVTSGTAPLAVKFTDQSTGTAPLTYAWDFDNNGITDSTLQNPVYTYSTAGSYTANLTVSNTAGSNSITHVITVNAAPVIPTAVFSTNVTSGTAPLAVKFTDQSTGTAPLTYAWDFDNNGIADSTLQNPVFTYSTSGSYTANLTVSNTAGSNSITHVITVNAAPVIPTAVFSTNVTSGTAPLAVKFTDASTGSAPLSYAWDFDNNGITDSTLQNPVFTYSTSGSYTANLTVSNTAGSNSITHVITVNAAPVIPKTLIVRAGAANDGHVAAWTGPTYIPLRNRAGQSADTATYANYAGLHATGSSNQYDEFYRAVVLFNTSALPDDCTVTAVKFGVMGISKNNGLGSFSYGITGFNPTRTDGTFVMGDYQRYYNDRWADSDIPYANLLTSGWNNWTGNSRFMANISRTGWTGVMVRDKPDIDNNSALITWKSGATSGFDFQDVGYGTAPLLEITYTTSPGSPVAVFSSNVSGGIFPLPVQFTDQSTGAAPLTYAWDFDNNGITDSTLKDPVFTYSAAGTFNAKLTVSNTAGSNSATRTISVTATPVVPVAAFSTNVTSGTAPLAVKFTDASTGTSPLSYAWDFDNNGITDSTLQNPVFTYSTTGSYTANLTVTNTAGSNSVTRTISVNAAPPVAAFSTNITSGTAPLAVKFTDASAGTAPLTYAWDFDNNGVTDSTVRNPTNIYSTAGTYTANLTVTNTAGSNSVTHVITVSPEGTSTAGIALTFDDNYVDEWFATRNIFQQYNAHATFFISNFNALDQAQIDKLKVLQADGHEIAFHGYNHEDVVEYLQGNTLNDYMNNEIIQGINLMKSNGFNPVNFAFPYGSDDPRATAAMTPYFQHMRDTYYDWDDTIYYEYGSNTPYIAGIGIDDNTYGNTMTDIYNGIAKAKTDDRILIFYCHKPVPGSPGEYETSYARIENILLYVSENNMKTYTIAEIH